MSITGASSAISACNVVLASCLCFIVLLVVFRVLFTVHGQSAAIGFYVLVDIFSVVLVEQFWSLANTSSSNDEGRRSYWFVGSGGLMGGGLQAVQWRPDCSATRQ